MPLCTAAGLDAAVTRIFVAAGAPSDIAAKVAGWLVNSDLSGHTSHGVGFVPSYVESMRTGAVVPAERPQILAETATTLLLDGRCGFGLLAADLLVRTLADKARAIRLAMGGIVRANHIGRLGEWAELGAELGVLLFLTYGHEGRLVAPYGGAEGRFGTNPIAFGAPTGDGAPIALDIATSVVAGGKLRVAQDKGADIPAGWIIDRHGRPTTSLPAYHNGGALLPFGAHKGSGLALMSAILGTNLTGSMGHEPARGGVFALAIDPGAFIEADAFLRATRATLAHVRQTPPAEGFDRVRVAGDPEREARARLCDAGVEIPPGSWDAITRTAARLGLDAAALTRLATGA